MTVLRTLRAVVVGTEFGARVHVPALRAAGYDIVAIVGRDEDKTRAAALAADIPVGTVSLEQALGLAPDVVTFAVPPGTREGMLAMAFAAGCHVLCEKPFARNLDEAIAITRAARDAGVGGIVGFEFRFAEDNALADRLVRSGAIGTPRMVSSTLMWGRTADPTTATPDWWWSTEQGGGWLNVAVSHTVDQLRSWFGPIDAVSAHLTHVSQRGAATEDTVLIHAVMSETVGTVQHCSAVWGADTYEPVTTIVGDLGSLLLKGQTVQLSDRDGARIVPVPPELQIKRLPPPVSRNSWQVPQLEVGPYSSMLASWSRSLQGHELLGPSLPTFEDATASTAVLDAIKRSAGQLVSVTAQDD